MFEGPAASVAGPFSFPSWAGADARRLPDAMNAVDSVEFGGMH
jgi:hypothetical protein